MALVRDFMVGNTRIQIYDDKCVSKEEAKVLVAHFSRIAHTVRWGDGRRAMRGCRASPVSAGAKATSL